MIILGIDPGITKTNPCGLALLDWPKDRLIETWAVYDKARVYEAIWQALINAADRADAVAVEEPPFVNSHKSHARLCEVVGMAIAASCRFSLPLLRVKPSQAKLALAGSGSADKDAMMDAVNLRYGVAVSKDAADAVGVALYGASVFKEAQ